MLATIHTNDSVLKCIRTLVNQSSVLKYKNKNGRPTQNEVHTMQSSRFLIDSWVSRNMLTRGCIGLAYSIDHVMP